MFSNTLFCQHPDNNSSTVYDPTTTLDGLASSKDTDLGLMEVTVDYFCKPAVVGNVMYLRLVQNCVRKHMFTPSQYRDRIEAYLFGSNRHKIVDFTESSVDKQGEYIVHHIVVKMKNQVDVDPLFLLLKAVCDDSKLCSPKLGLIVDGSKYQPGRCSHIAHRLLNSVDIEQHLRGAQDRVTALNAAMRHKKSPGRDFEVDEKGFFQPEIITYCVKKPAYPGDDGSVLSGNLSGFSQINRFQSNYFGNQNYNQTNNQTNNQNHIQFSNSTSEGLFKLFPDETSSHRTIVQASPYYPANNNTPQNTQQSKGIYPDVCSKYDRN